MATATVVQLPPARKSPINKSGVLTIHGFGVRVRMQRGHLEIEDGVGPERRRFKLARVGHGLRRLVMLGSDGFVTFEALRWLAAQDVSFTFLDGMGKVLFVSGPVSPSDARLRRAQALATQNGAALEIARELITAKLQGQEHVAHEQLKDVAAADLISNCRERLSSAASLDVVRTLESQAAVAYWSAWNTLPIMFPRKEMDRVPLHWRTFGTRKSPLTGSPRLAVNPPGAVLNYCYGLLESESRLALAKLGLDPGLGVLHLDAAARDSLACDLMEAARPAVDAWLLDWIMREPWLRSWFLETQTGNCRLISSFATKLSETAPMWGGLIAPYAERIAAMLWSRRRTPSSEATLPTRLTQRRKRTVKGADPLSNPKRMPKRETLCRGCGKQIGEGHVHCTNCNLELEPIRLAIAARKGKSDFLSPETQARKSDAQRINTQACWDWNDSNQPLWLTRDFYLERIQPRIASMVSSEIAKSIGVSRCYATMMRKGYVPHPRHWIALAGLAGVSE